MSLKSGKTAVSLLSLLALVWGLVPADGNSASALTLARNGKTDYRIVVSATTIESERTAADELASYLWQVTGADFRVVTELEVGPDAPQILVGQSERAKRLAPDLDWASLRYDGIVIRTVGNKLILAGDQPRGSLYAVYSFLEDSVGCRWWTATEGYIPHKPTLKVPSLNVKYTPQLRYREALYLDPVTNPKFAVKLKLNGHFYNIPQDYGGHYHIIGFCHTTFNLIPPSIHLGPHPDWFAEINGRRTADMAQLCFSNEEMQKELTRVVLEQISKNPTAGIISISQMDWHGYCQCAKCRAIEEEEGGAHSAPLIRCVNKVAEEVEKQYPHVLVETLAYQYTRKPPLKTKPRENVVIRLCTIECDYSKPIDSEANKSSRDDITKWANIAPNLYVWDYVTDFASHIQPHPNMRVLAPNIRFFVKNNAIGVFEQGDCNCPVGDFVHLRAWLIGHLLWNPGLDEKKLTTEFLNGYYGAAAPYIQQYLDVVHDASDRSGKFIGCFNGDLSFLTLDDMTKATELFEKAALAVADDPEISKRIRRERMPLDHVWFLRHKELKQTAQEARVPFVGPQDPAAAVEEWVALAREYKTVFKGEGRLFEAYVHELRRLFEPPTPTPEAFEQMPPDDYINLQQDKLTLHALGTDVKLVDDPKASDGQAVWMTGANSNWSIQYHIPDGLLAESPDQDWKCYIIARTEGAPTGGAFRYGLYDDRGHRDVAVFGEHLQTSSDGLYHTYYLGTHKFAQGFYFWVAPVSNPGVKGIYVDRMILVPKKPPTKSGDS